MFTHVDCPELPNIDKEEYPRVTSISSLLNEEAIAKWRERIGEEAANKISNQAASKGSQVHLMVEKYLNNDQDYREKQTPICVKLFDSIKPILDRYINNIVLQERRIFSDHLQVRGTPDCIAEFDNKLSIIDFKTSRKTKKKEWIENYFIQTSAYAVAWEEQTQQPINQLVIIIAVDDAEPQVFIERRDNWIDQFIKLREQYKETKGI